MSRTRLIASLLTSFLLSMTAAAQEYHDWDDTLQTAHVSAVKEKMRNTTQTGLMRLDSKKLNAGYAVFGSPDIIKTLQLLPGVAAGNELMSGLYVHGGDGNDNLFLLDGVPLYNISHFGGLFSSFNTDVVDNLDFYKSGFPARYGGRMSSVVDVETREGNMYEYHGSLSIGLIDGRVQVEGPIIKGRTSFNLGLRRSWMDAVLVPAMWYVNRKYGSEGSRSVGYYMQDINARITHILRNGDHLDLSVYSGKDNMHAGLGLNQSDTDEAGTVHSGETSMDIGVTWGSTTASVAWKHDFSKKLKSTLRAYWSRSSSDTGYDFDLWTWMGMDYDYIMDDDNVSYINDLGASYDFDFYPNEDNHIRYGATAAFHTYHSSREYSQYSMLAGVKYDPTGSEESLHYNAFEPAVYAEDEIFIRYNLTANAGMRLALFSVDGRTWTSPEPRIALKWLINKDVSAKLSYTRMGQFAHLVSAMYMDLPSNSWMPSTKDARPMISDQIAGGIYTTPAKNFKLNIEGWYKTMDHMLAYDGMNSFYPPLTDWEKSFTEGKGKSYGAEFEATYDNGTVSLSAYYTLSWTLRKFDAYYPDWFLDRNDNRHKLNLVASWNLPAGFDIFANWNYHTGNRITFPSHVVKTNGEPDGTEISDQPYNSKLPDYHRLDVGVNYRHKTSKGNEFIVNLSVYNAYNHVNPSFAFLSTDDDGNYVGTAYGLVPIIPTFSLTYKF